MKAIPEFDIYVFSLNVLLLLYYDISPLQMLKI